MKLISLEHIDLNKAYFFYQGFSKEENGFECDGSGLSFEAFLVYVKEEILTSKGINLPK